jgi:hypothetical protein
MIVFVRMAWEFMQRPRRLLGLVGHSSFTVKEESSPSWPENADVLILPGLGLDSSSNHYPEETTRPVVDRLESRFDVRFATGSRPAALYSPWEILMPIIAFTVEALANGAGDLFADAIRSQFPQGLRRSQRMIIKAGRVDTAKGTVRWFEGEGPPDKLVAAMKRALEP